MAWFKRTKDAGSKKVKIPEGMWVKCDSCKEIIYRKEIERNLKICPKCNYHFRITAFERIAILADENSFIELDAELSSADPLDFRDKVSYKDKLVDSRKKSGLREAVLTGSARVGGHSVIMAIMDFSFMGGSMGSVVGEKLTKAAELALEAREPLVVVSSSGGARMQEGIFSLMQMAKVSAAIGKLKESAVPFISILSDPTFGGVTASISMLGDVIMAEPRCLVGFAGPRIIEQTIKQQLPENFQRAEFLLDHGVIDMIVERKSMKKVLAKLLDHLKN